MDLTFSVSVSEEYLQSTAPKRKKKKKKEPIPDLPGPTFTVKVTEEFCLLEQEPQELHIRTMTREEILAEQYSEEMQSLMKSLTPRRLHSRRCLTTDPLAISYKESREKQVCFHCGTSMKAELVTIQVSMPGKEEFWLTCLMCESEMERARRYRDYEHWVEDQLNPQNKEQPLPKHHKDKIPSFEIWLEAVEKDRWQHQAEFKVWWPLWRAHREENPEADHVSWMDEYMSRTKAPPSSLAQLEKKLDEYKTR